MQDRSRRTSGTQLILLSSIGLICTAQAQGQAAGDESKEKEVPSLEEVVVTGTLLPTAPDRVPVPIVTLDAKALEQNGVTANPLEILRKSVPAFAGRSNAGSSNAINNNQNTGGGSQLQLRNLPTLVLVNGRRLANSAISAVTGGKNFVDVNQIPAAAIDHIEVLTDGASSIYGSDAIGGVVNFILKQEDEGLSAGGRYGSANGDYREQSGFISGGTNLGGWKISATGSYSKTNPLFQNARAFSSPIFTQPAARIPGAVTGAILAPSLRSPSQTNPTGTAATATSLSQLIANGTYLANTNIGNTFDVTPYQMLLAQQEQDTFVTSISKSLFDGGAELFTNVLYSHDKSYRQWTPNGLQVTVPAGAPYNPLTTSFPNVSFSDTGLPEQINDTTDALRVVAGLRGKVFGEWHWETAVDYSQSELTEKQANVIYKPNVALALAGGYDANGNPVAGGAYSKVFGNFSNAGTAGLVVPALDPFARSGRQAATLAALYGTEAINARSQLLSWDGKVTGSVFSLPAGNVDAAVGAAWREEKISGHTDANGRNSDPVTGNTNGNDQFWQGGTFSDPFKHSRSITSVFTEARLPVTSEDWNVPAVRELDLTGAVRYEKYSDSGSSTVPKVGFRWRPFGKDVTIRGTYAKSFSAPGMNYAYGPTDTRTAGGAIIPGTFPNANPALPTSLPFQAEDGNNPNLKASTSVTRSIGIVFQPAFVPGLTANVDFSSIDLYGYAGGIGFNNILGSVNSLGSASPFFNLVGVGAFAGTPGATQPFVHPGDLLTYLQSTGSAQNLYVQDHFENLAVLSERSYTIGVNYALPWDGFGKWDISTTGAIFKSFKFQSLAGQPFIEYAGAANNTGVFGGTLPKRRFFSTVNWAYRGLDVTLSNTYVSGVDDTGLNGTLAPIPVGSYVTWDMRAAYNWKVPMGAATTMTTAVGVNNLSNKMPPLAPRAFSGTNADVAAYSPIGRLVYGTVTVSF